MRLQLALLVNVGAQDPRAALVCFELGSCYTLVSLEQPAKHYRHLERTARNVQSIQMESWQ